ncbi:MAG: hypothetical protein C5B47_04225 [Verrucomicrobia bacterium]|nr:MAG: hypothetical protein C5B47_04225 [Verrucomicrobiota bacterium]
MANESVDLNVKVPSHSWVWEDGHFEPTAFIPIEDRGFRYGMSVFETVAIVKRKAILMTPHLLRLEAAAALLNFPIGQRALNDLMEFQKSPPFNEGLLRIHWTAGDGGPADPISEGRLIVRGEEIAIPGSSAPMPELSLVMIKTRLHEQDGWKTGNYLTRCRLLAEARRRGAHEALLYEDTGLLLGAIMANVFLISHAGRLVTPRLQPGCRNGTVREWVMKHHNVEEKEIDIEEAASAKEILLTNSRLGIAGVADLEGRKLERRVEKIECSYRELFDAQCY